MAEAFRGVGCVLAVVGFVSGVSSSDAAQIETELRTEASVDGGVTWSSMVAALPGQTVYFRLRAIALQGDVIGFSGFVCQPTLTGWNETSDQLRPFDFPGLLNDGTLGTEAVYDGRAVSPTPASNTGRMFPFGSSGMGLGSNAGLLTAFSDPGNVLRFAGSKNLVATLNPAWGVAFSQAPQSLAGTLFQTGSDVVVFRYAVTLGESNDVIRTATVGNVSGNVVRWFLNGTPPDFPQNVIITPATIVPGPGVIALLGTITLAVSRRRR